MSLQRTPLFESCRSAGGRMVPFAGWEMPVQFSGLIQEHKAVRERVGRAAVLESVSWSWIAA